MSEADAIRVALEAGGYTDAGTIRALLGEVEALRAERDRALLAANDNAEERDRNKAQLIAAEAERDRVREEREVYRNATISLENALHAAEARAEAAEAERDQWMSACDAAVEEARGYYEAMDGFRSDLDECRAARDEWATKDMEDYRRAVAAETRIAAALAIIERGENVDVGDESDHAVFALGWGNAAAELRAALVEPVEPQPSTCATCGDKRVVPNDLPGSANANLTVPCPSCAPTEPGDATDG